MPTITPTPRVYILRTYVYTYVYYLELNTYNLNNLYNITYTTFIIIIYILSYYY